MRRVSITRTTGCAIWHYSAVIPALSEDGWLPRGRFCASLAEVKERFVDDPAFVTSRTRAKVWQDFEAVLALIEQQRVKVPAVFLGGSFLTSTVDPGDIDVAFFVDVSRISNPATLTGVTRTVRGAKLVGLEVDGFLIQWSPDGSQKGAEPSYTDSRGFWDDFWQRFVPKADRQPPQRQHSMPRRGYLEVIVDGYR